MALTIGRWIAAAVVGGLIVTVLVLTPGRSQARVTNPRAALVRGTSRLQGHATRAALDLRFLQIRDSVARKFPGVSPAVPGRALISEALPPSIRPAIQSTLARMALFRAAAPAQGADVAFVFDTGSTVRGAVAPQSFLRVAHALPGSSQPRCLMVVRMDWVSSGNPDFWKRRLTNEGTALQLLGPCGFYEWFGAPGTGLDAWLRDGAWRYGAGGPWFRSRPSAAMRRFRRYDWRIGSEGFFTRWNDLRRVVGAPAFRCVSGDDSTCRALVIAGPTDPAARRRGAASDEGMVWPTLGNDGYPIGTTALGPAEPTLLADMVRLLGEERFRRFWTSDRPAADAFREATGEDIGVWTARWARGVYGELGRGPGIQPSSAGFALVVSLLAFGGTLAAVRRRQVA